jgi:alpha-glucosidase
MVVWSCLMTMALGNAELSSPDGHLCFKFQLDQGKPTYQLLVDSRPIIAKSRLGFSVDGAGIYLDDCVVLAQRKESHDSTWQPVYGERSVIRDHYHQVEIDLADERKPTHKVTLIIRAYNEGVAFCYRFPKQEDKRAIEITDELTEFCFTADHDCWPVYSAQGVYRCEPISRVEQNCERPLLVRAGRGWFVAVGEARLVDFARMRLEPVRNRPYALKAQLAGNVNCSAPMTTPWRYIMIGQSPGELLERNYLLLNLNEPCALADTSWIKPGKVIREVTLTTQGGKACVDFAVANGLQYVEFDAGWYGHEYDRESDATTITVDPKRSPGPLDLHHVIRYADERGIGVILYVNRRALEGQLDAILPLYQRWGVRGVKYGFVQVGSQKWTSWLHHAVRQAAQHELMVDIHDEYRPTGYSRTYPNLMTQEGIAGDETSPTNEQTLTILFTRMLAGAGDNTICYFNSRVDKNASHAYQLAKAVCLYSPWQFLYWYDRPLGSPGTKGGAGGQAGVIGGEPELDLFARVPTVWDETRVLHGVVGQCAVIARRSGEEWFVGAMTDSQPRQLTLPLEFLSAGRQYLAKIYSDDPTVTTRTHVRITEQIVDADTVFDIVLASKCGEAIYLKPLDR